LSATAKVLRFGVFELNLASGELRKSGALIKLPPQPFKILVLLAGQSGQIVTREEIQREVWGDETFVDFEQGMNHCIKQIRTALSDNADTPLYVETLPRRGYRFLAPVVVKTPATGTTRVTESASGIESDLSALILSKQAAKEASGAASVSGAPSVTLATSVSVASAPAREQVPPAPSRSTPRTLISWAALGLLVVVGGIFAYRFWRGAPSANQVTDPATIKLRPTVAVLGLRNLSGRRDQDYLATALAEMLTADLTAGNQLRTVTGEDVATMKINLALKDAASYNKETLGEIRKNLNVDKVVVGAYFPEGADGVHLDVYLQDTSTGETPAVVRLNGSVSQLHELVQSAGAELREKLNVATIPDAEATAVRASMPSNAEAARLYSEGLAKLRLFDAAAGRDLLEKAVAAEPNYALAHSALAEALNFLGYEQKAQEEAEEAFRLSATLLPEDKLAVEARYYDMSRQWNQAIKLYQTLWRDYPDNLEYGLRLAASQRRASLSGDALATVAQMRALPPPSRNDPRIDLAEAYARALRGEWKLEQEAAKRAGVKAQAQSRSLILAEAWSAEGNSLLGQGEDLSGALNLYKQALQIYRQSGDKRDEASLLNNSGSALQGQGDLAAAEAKYKEALEICRSIGARGLAATALTNLGALLQKQGHLDGAEALYEQALEIHREVKNKNSEAIVLNNMAEVLYDKGDLAAARDKYEQVLSMYIELGDKAGEAYARFYLGEVLAAQDELAAARRSHEQALAIRKSIGESTAESLLALAVLRLEEGGGGNIAANNARTAAAEFHDGKLVDEEAHAEEVLARSLLVDGKLEQATEAIARAGTLAGQITDPALRLPVTIEIEITAASIRAASGRRSDQALALKMLERSRAAAAKNRFVGLQLQAALALAETEIQSGQEAAGRAHLQTLEKGANAHGFLLIARKAASARQLAVNSH
jgi:DNA-binding winged helix-turn-helix (wHTH) protein/tetratricopeptide (TPR) repeat protein